MHYRIKKAVTAETLQDRQSLQTKRRTLLDKAFCLQKTFKVPNMLWNFFLLQKSCAKCKNTNFLKLKQRVVAVQIGNTLAGGVFMKCFGCNREIDNNDYCICTKCRKTMCPQCAAKNSFVCSQCGGDIAYLS